MARHREAPDSAIIECLASVVAAGHGAQPVLGGDVARRIRYLSYGGMPELAYLPERFVPRLVERIGRGAVDRLLVTNPAAWLAFEPTAG